MNIILLNPKKGHSRTIKMPRPLLGFLFLVLFAIPVCAGVSAYYFMLWQQQPVFTPETARQWKADIFKQQDVLAQVTDEADEQLRALTVRMAEMQARLVRLDALGERLVDVSGIHGEEFDFSAPPAVGGPENTAESSQSVAYMPPGFMDELNRLAEDIDQRAQQMRILEDLLAHKKHAKQVYLSGRPIERGWMSSRYGYRTDPFSGKLAMHKGVDFAGKDDSPIVATASGVVTFAGKRWGYGLLVEVNHGNGLSTRYGHAKELLVKAGDIVSPGQQIAKMGSTGRSTGPHVHYEVLRNGRQVDPAPYVHRARR